MEKKYLTAEEVAKRFQVQARTVRIWIKTKGLPAIKIGNTVRFDEAALEKWIKEQSKKGGE